MIEKKKEFVLRKGKIYLLLRDFFNLRRSFCNKSKSVATIKCNVKYLVILDHFPFLRKVYNFIDIFFFE